jgi:hypothetical protein
MAAAPQRIGLTVSAISALAPSVAAAPMLSSASVGAATASAAALAPSGAPDGLFSTAMLTPSFQTGLSFSDKFCIDAPRDQNAPPVPFNTLASSTVEVLTAHVGSLPRSVGCSGVLTFTAGNRQVGTRTEVQISAAVVWGLGWGPFYVYVSLPSSQSR